VTVAVVSLSTALVAALALVGYAVRELVVALREVAHSRAIAAAALAAEGRSLAAAAAQERKTAIERHRADVAERSLDAELRRPFPLAADAAAAHASGLQLQADLRQLAAIATGRAPARLGRDEPMPGPAPAGAAGEAVRSGDPMPGGRPSP